MIPILNRINELSRIERSIGLSDTEKTEQVELRKQYLQYIRGQVISTLLNVSVLDELGNDITPQKLVNEKTHMSQ